MHVHYQGSFNSCKKLAENQDGFQAGVILRACLLYNSRVPTLVGTLGLLVRGFKWRALNTCQAAGGAEASESGRRARRDGLRL